MVIGPAHESDLPEVFRLLEAHHLPADGVTDHLATMVVATDSGRLVGVAAVEVYADGALLRSVAVDSTQQGQGLGHRLVEAALEIARGHGVDTVFLLTTTAEHFFPKFGFEWVTRDEVPASVQASIEFRSACPASAAVMRRRLAVLPATNRTSTRDPAEC